MSRETSFEASSSVKDFYKSYYGSGTDLVDWWTTLVRNLDLTDAMDKKAEERDEPWSAIIARTVAEENLQEGRGSDGTLDAVAAAEAADEAKKLWANKYKTVLEFAEKLNSVLPWTTALEERPSIEGLERFSKQVPLRNETVTLDFEEPSVANSSFLYVTPRFFRGIGMDEELVRSLSSSIFTPPISHSATTCPHSIAFPSLQSAFLEFAKIVTSQLRNSDFVGATFDLSKVRVDVTPLHPLMVTLDGAPDFARRAPHPALLFTMRQL
jgi:hypothetical protein